MNPTQTQTTLAPFVAFLAGLLAGKGVFGLDATTWAAILGSAAGLGTVIWGALATRKSALVSTTSAMPEVKGIVTTNTIEGRALAASIPGPDVAAAGTTDAKVIAAIGATS